MREGDLEARNKMARRRFQIRLKLGQDAPALTTAKAKDYLEWNFEEVHSMGPSSNFHQGKAVAGLLSAEWDAVVTTRRPTKGTGVVLPKQLRGPAKGDPPIRFALAGFAASRDKEERASAEVRHLPPSGRRMLQGEMVGVLPVQGGHGAGEAGQES